MRRICFFIIWFSFSIYFLPAQDTLPLKYARTITATELEEHVTTLASDGFEGRSTGTRGLAKAQNYISGEFREDGLQTPEIAGKPTFIQEFELNECRWKDQRMTVDGMELRVGKDFLFLSDPVDISGEFPVVFAGFGIDDTAYSDFGGIAVKGKVMLAFSGEPRDENGISYLSKQKEQSRKGYYFSKAAEAANREAEGVFIISRKKSDYKRFLKDRDYYDPRPHIEYPGKDEDSLKHKDAFAAFMNVKTAALLVGQKPALLKDALNEMESSGKTAAGRFSGQVSIRAASECSTLETANVVAVIEGTDLKEEAVVVVAHYDHLGIMGGEVYHGADDNASGTAAVMEIADAFAAAAVDGIRPRRTVIFLAVSAEELGIYGSKYYTENPVIALDSTFACVNMDMIGRASSRLANSPEYISGTAYVSEKIVDFSRRSLQLAAPELEDRVEYKSAIRGGSDHYYFARAGIPSLFYFAGFHKDYHETTDTADKILYDRMEKIVRVIFLTTWELASTKEKL
jgi:hypothetical protein